MRTSVLSTILAAGMLTVGGATTFGDDDDRKWEQSDRQYSNKERKDHDKERRKEYKDWHKEQSKEHKDKDSDEKHGWQRGDHYGSDWQRNDRDGRSYSTSRGQGDWRWQGRGEHDRYQDRRQYGAGYNRDRHDSKSQYDRRNDNRWESDRSGKDHNWQGHSSDRDRHYGQSRGDNKGTGFSRPLANTSKISFNQLPTAVQRTVREHAKGATIEDVERGTFDGRTVYEVAFKQDGIHNELRVYEDGNVMRRIAGNNIQFPGTLRLSEVPTAVQHTIRERIGSAEINDIDRMEVNGRVVYEVGFKRGDGIQREIQIAESGTVITEAAGADRHR